MQFDSAGKLRAFGGDHDTEIAAACVALANNLSHLIDVERNFWHKDHIGAAANTAVGGDPARVAPHDFDDDHAIMSLGGSVYAVDGVGRDVHGGVEAKGKVG